MMTPTKSAISFVNVAIKPIVKALESDREERSLLSLGLNAPAHKAAIQLECLSLQSLTLLKRVLAIFRYWPRSSAASISM